MNRRTFLSALAALPLVGRFVPLAKAVPEVASGVCCGPGAEPSSWIIECQRVIYVDTPDGVLCKVVPLTVNATSKCDIDGKLVVVKLFNGNWHVTAAECP